MDRSFHGAYTYIKWLQHMNISHSTQSYVLPTDPTAATYLYVFENASELNEVKGTVHPCTSNEALYRPYCP
jgi:hypothetical protein